MLRNAVIAVVLGISAGLATSAHAQLIGYQGVLETSGAPAAGVHQIRFRVYDAGSGGTLLAEQLRERNFIASDDGCFTFNDLNFGDALMTGSARWIELAVRQGTAGAFTVLGPRQFVTAAPVAQYATISGTDLDEAYDRGHRITNADSFPVVVEGSLQLGSSVTDGRFDLYCGLTNPTGPVLTLTRIPAVGGSLHIFDEANVLISNMEADVTGFGTWCAMVGGSGSMFVWDGYGDANPGGTLEIWSPAGVSSLFFYDSNLTGDPALIVPDGAVNAHELLNEPGTANNHATVVSIPSNGTLATLLSRSITCPTAGYVIAFANADLAISYTGSTVDYMFGVSDSATTLSMNQDMQVRLPEGLPAGIYDFPAVAHGLFVVATPGTHTFYFNAGGAFGQAYPSQYFYDPQLTLLFVPTAYGNIIDNMPTGDALLGNTGPGLPGMTPAEIYAEQQAEMARARAEREAREAELQRQIDELRAQVARLGAEQPNRP